MLAVSNPTYLSFLNFLFRHLLNDMSKKSLSERFINRRTKICQINIKVNFISWIVEFLGCMTIALNFLVIGSKNNELTGLLKILTMLVFIVILPCTFLVNSSAGINTIVDHSWVNAISRLFNPVQESEEVRIQNDIRGRREAAQNPSENKRMSRKTIPKKVEPRPLDNQQLEKAANNFQRTASKRKIKIAWE